MKHTRIAEVIALMVGSILLTACGMSGPFPGVPELHSPSRSRPNETPKQVAPPQVVYRIDESRFFELVPNGAGACTDATVYYVDKGRSIRSSVVRWDRGVMGGNNFIIDAANDQYLIGPATRGNTDCSSGGGGCGGDRLPYSTDAGRTWKRADPVSPSAPMSISGSRVYAIDTFDLTESMDLTKGSLSMRDWHSMPKGVLPSPPRKAPIDTKFHCAENGKE